MRRRFLAFGTAISLITMLLVARRWKMPYRPSLVGAASVALAAALPFRFIYRLCRTAKAIAAAMFAQIAFTLGLAFALLVYRVTRDPERVAPQEGGVAVAAADGQVIYIKTVERSSTPLVTKHARAFRLAELMGTSLIANGAYVIGVEMNMLNIHTNRCPIGGRVKLINHIGGKFISLRDDEAPFVNERCTTVIENDSIAVAVVQVASRLVRRIENYLRNDDTVCLGQRLGMIRFGSLVAVVLPKRDDVRIETQVGDYVTAGVSILARYAEGSRSAQKR